MPPPPTTTALARFVTAIRFEDIPATVIHEGKRVLLDSIGCAVAGLNTDRGRASLAVVQALGGPPEASVFGTGHRVSAATAAFANGETINAQDFDAILRPAVHVTPWTIPAAISTAERVSSSGPELLVAIVLAHEMSNRLAKALLIGDRRTQPTVSGYSFNALSAAAVAARILGLSEDGVAHAIAIASYNAPVASYAAWEQSGTSALIKYGSAGMVAQTGVVSALMASAGYSGELTGLDGPHGFWRRAGATAWRPEALLDELGEDWQIADVRYKRFPCCGITHSALDAFTSLMADHQLDVNQVDNVKVWLDPTVELPLWQDRRIDDEVQAQFSVAYNIAVAAHQRIPYRAWLNVETRADAQVRSFMEKVEVFGLPEFDEAAAVDRTVQLAKVEIKAGDKTIRRESRYPSGRASPEHAAFTDTELENKFRDNVRGRLADDQVNRLLDGLWALELVQNVSTLMPFARTGES